jgi:DNA-binding GntR family transcriptional regulator
LIGLAFILSQGNVVAVSKASERAYAEIRGLILSGDAPPGTQLTEAQLADICGVSRTPVREALRRLETELYLIRSDSQRIFVADWNSDDLAEMFTLRAMLEAHAAGRAATRIDGAALDHLRAANDRIAAAAAADTPDVATFLSENRCFHDIVIAAAGSPRLAAMLAAIVEQPVVRRTAARYSRTELARSIHEHGELIQAFATRDADWARAVMTGHIRRAFHAFSAAEPVA